MAIDQALYQGTPNDDLTYAGNDVIVWDRVNAERLRRGLQGLAQIGFPRPADATGSASTVPSGGGGSGSGFSFTANGQTFECKVPAGTSEAQARALFEKELNSGKLTNLNVGQSLQGLPKAVGDTLGQLGKLTDVAVGLPVNPAQLLKQVPATVSIGSLDPKQVTGLLGQATAAVGQAASAFSVAKGIGKFGLTPQQLQEQGFLKPGTVEQFLGKGNVDFTSVLSSPGCWTGKGGASGLDGFLKNPNLQDVTQQGLMTKGLDQLKSLGTLTGRETPQQLSAMVQGAAKFGAADMAAWSKGAAPAGLVDSINGLCKNAQFATELTDQLPVPLEAIGEGAVDTVDRSTVDNSVKGFVGNDKVPAPTYGPVERTPVADPNRSLEEQFTAEYSRFFVEFGRFRDAALALNQQLIDLESGVITQQGWDQINAELQALRADYNANADANIFQPLKTAYWALPPDLRDQYESQYQQALRFIINTGNFLKYIRDRIRDDEQFIGQRRT